MEFDLGFLEEKGIDTKTGLEYTGGMEKYLSAIKRYYSNFESNKEKLIKYFEDGDLKNYMIQVHALKSNSKMVGATDLAKDFEALEQASREGDKTFVSDNGERVLQKYCEFVNLIKPIGEADIEKPADEIDGERAREVTELLLEALDDFDDEKSLELAKILSGYPFRLRQKEELGKAIKLITQFEYDDAAEIIREISESIE